jgi:polysaccharide export outer membrane protein
MKTRLQAAAISVFLLTAAISHAAMSGTGPAPAAKANASRGPVVTAKAKAKADYVLQPEDQLKVFVFQEDDINKQGEVSISQEYTITLPMIGIVNLKGMTPRQAEEKIRSLYDKDYLIDPQITVTVQKYAERFVTILGSVKKAGKVLFPSEGGMTLLEAIGGAEGHDRLASLKAVKLTRKDSNGEPVTEQIDVSAIIESKREDIPLQHGDQIYIPERIL